MLTLSRTNILALIIVGVFAVILKLNFKQSLLLICGLVAALVSMENFVNDYGISPLKLILNPILILEDTSFAVRSESAWTDGFQNNYVRLLIGNGLGSVRVSDGLYNKLFIGVGLIGFLTYLSIVIIMFSKFKKI